MPSKTPTPVQDAYSRALKKIKKFIGLRDTDPEKDPMGLGNTSGGRSKAADEATVALAEHDKAK